MQVNQEDVVAEVRARFEDYERALVANDVEALKTHFWDSPHALRFGVTEELYGADEISAFRAARKINFTDRTSLKETVVSLGRDLAVTTLEFSVVVTGVGPKHGRQSQVWVRFPDAGWKIVSAHVSHKVVPPSGEPAKREAAAFAAAAADLLHVPVDPAFKGGVAMNLEVMARLFQPLMEFELPPETEPAPRFTP